MKGSEFVLYYVHLLDYKYHKINLNRVRSYIDSPDQITNRRTTINPINKTDNKCFQYGVTLALNYEKIGKYPERITKIKPFINKYNWEKINFPLEKNDWKKFEKNNVKISLIILYAKKEKIYILLMFQKMIPKWRRMALSLVNRLSAFNFEEK